MREFNKTIDKVFDAIEADADHDEIERIIFG